jgi:hypothetical protein
MKPAAGIILTTALGLTLGILQAKPAAAKSGVGAMR